MSSDASTDDNRPLTDGSLLGGRYRLGELLGVGSSAAVFAATDVTVEDGPPLAVKVLHAHLCQNPDVLVAFHREGKASTTVRHPLVVRVEAWGDHDAGGISVGWLALERIDGDTLLEIVDGRGRLSPEEAVEVMYGVLDGLEAIHAVGLVHRDLTPRNVLISGASDGPITRDHVHIADLGLADVTGGTALVADREVVGTPAYISPEQVTGEAVDPRADLYQAGALLYYLLVGQPPYPRETTAKIVHAHLYAPPPVPSAHVGEAAPLDRVVTRAMSKKPAARYQSAAEFGEALDLAWRPVTATSAEPPVAMTAVMPAVSTPAQYLPVAAVTPSPQPYRRQRTDNRAGLVAALVLALLVLVPVLQTILPGSASASGATSASPTPTGMAVVPLLSGTVEEAQAALTGQGFVVGQVTPRDSGEAAGRLLEQHPEPGSMSPRGSAVDLVVASGSNVVPPVAGLSVTAAIAALKASGFVPAAGGLSASSRVGSSSPAAGVVKKLGTTVALVVVTPSATPTPSPTVESPTPAPAVTPSTPPPSTRTSTSPTPSRTATSSVSGGA